MRAGFSPVRSAAHVMGTRRGPKVFQCQPRAVSDTDGAFGRRFEGAAMTQGRCKASDIVAWSPDIGEFTQADAYCHSALNPSGYLSEAHLVRVRIQDPRRSWAACERFHLPQGRRRATRTKRQAPRNCPGLRGLIRTGFNHGSSGPDSS